jgi:hypothetical protein
MNFFKLLRDGFKLELVHDKQIKNTLLYLVDGLEERDERN